MNIEKRATKLHNKQVSDKKINQIMKRTSFENMGYIKRIVYNNLLNEKEIFENGSGV
jgi:hypothetical protein